MAIILVQDTMFGSGGPDPAHASLHMFPSGSVTGTVALSPIAPAQTHGSGGDIVGVAILTSITEVTKEPTPLCQVPTPPSYRWGHQFGVGDLTLRLGSDAGQFGPVCITYTMYTMQKGCQPKPVGAINRKPGRAGAGCFYVTGFAWDCGQPGLWLVRWKYQITFGAPTVEKDCYFYVLDSVLCPIPGDTLPRSIKHGWD